MFTIKLILRNAFRHKLRAVLTIAGVAVAVAAFGLLRTLIGAWYQGVESSSASRLITRNAISLAFSLPISYKEKIRAVPGVKEVTYATWFGGIYISEKNFFPNFAVDADTYLDLYPEFLVSTEERKDFVRDRKGALIGRGLADRFGWNTGDPVTLKGTIFPGQWEFTVRGIYRGAEQGTDEGQFLFHWNYLNEVMKQTTRRRADMVGIFIETIEEPDLAAELSRTIDSLFENSLAETRTETERAFQMSFVAMTGAIVAAIQIVSYVVIVIIMVVAANTMAMTARERLSEYATMKTMGFGSLRIALVILGESITIALLGGFLGTALSFPAAYWIQQQLDQFFPVFSISAFTVGLEFLAALVVGVIAALFPAWRATRINIAEGLRKIG